MKPKRKKRREEIGGNTPRQFVMLMNRVNGGISRESGTSENKNKEKEKLSEEEKKELKKKRLEKKKKEEAERRKKEKVKTEQERMKQLKMLPGESFSEFSR